MTASPVFAREPRLVLAWGTVRDASFPDRVAAARQCGYDGIGLAIPYYQALLADGWTDRDLAAVLAEWDVRINEVEVLFGFHGTPGPAGIPGRPGLVYADPAAERIAFHLADTFGVPFAQTVGTFDARPAGPEVADAFGRLCDRAAAYGLRVALEFVPYSSIPDLAAGLAVVTEANRDNGGLCVDSWHFFRGRPDLESLRTVPAERVFMVQFNDGPIPPVDPDRMADAVHHRVLPGEGDLDLRSFVRALDRPGVEAPFSIEIYSDELRRRPAADAARLAAEATRAVVASAKRTY
ncbi:sugar phosphate isomerase/epimerase family protein [Streptomyces sp. NBC_01716]|uniref:sugar phosphate isomerase/epimerase family protein n=1 Tax=Streptomyces sp. NBC_01716 TaxID=2975917 RepID=UPI002E2EA685|nr:sugar phosphate isomerase/epimerase family protein [Streptomyces sp. NBC_01716]